MPCYKKYCDWLIDPLPDFYVLNNEKKNINIAFVEFTP